MSVDLEATLRQPITLAAMIEQTRTTLSDLLGVTDVPDLEVFADRQYRQGARTDPGRRLDAAGLAAAVIGDPIAPGESGLSGGVHFEIDVPATGDGVSLMVIDHRHEQFGEYRHRCAVFSPDRTCVGVVVATGLALAAARLARGEYLDEEIRMVRPGLTEPDQVVDQTRLAEGGSDFAARCETYLRQFPGLGGWPRDRSIPLTP
ncbi:hypothetical protein AB0N89_26200 [Amycolatopsis sp. NPDC089917]|uniref:hypothetical protein n=1 Tax=Amycolatopsis sp. NPDC089917 TaxID=3155187 RepID=UPI003425EAC4